VSTMRVCAHCGRAHDAPTDPNERPTLRRYCTLRCYNRARAERKRAKYQAARAAGASTHDAKAGRGVPRAE
jgi:hypothetical protein